MGRLNVGPEAAPERDWYSEARGDSAYAVQYPILLAVEVILHILAK